MRKLNADKQKIKYRYAKNKICKCKLTENQKKNMQKLK